MRVRLNIWVGCVGGLVANGGLDTVPGSIFADKGLKVTFKIIDDWTEGSAALATNNVDIMLTTADVWGKDFGQFQDKGVNAHAFYMVDWSRGADGVIGAQGIDSIEDLAGQDRCLRALHAVALPALERAEKLRPLHRAAQRDLQQGRAHQRRHRARHAVRAAEGGRRRRLGSRHVPTPSPSVPARTKSTTRAWPTA